MKPVTLRDPLVGRLDMRDVAAIREHFAAAIPE